MGLGGTRRRALGSFSVSSRDCQGDTIRSAGRRRRHLAASLLQICNASSAPVAIQRRSRKFPSRKPQHELLEELALRPLATPPPQAPRSRAAAAGVTGLAALLLRLPPPPQQASRLPACSAAAAVAET